jgi:hypothetical protein
VIQIFEKIANPDESENHKNIIFTFDTINKMLLGQWNQVATAQEVVRLQSTSSRERPTPVDEDRP